jgi:hypothetical protein
MRQDCKQTERNANGFTQNETLADFVSFNAWRSFVFGVFVADQDRAWFP